MDSIQITTGEKHIPIVRDGVNVGEIVFNPSDVTFAERFYKIASDFETTLTDYEARDTAISQELNTNGTPVHAAEHLQLLHETCTYIKEKIDYVFGPGTSELVFGSAMVLEMFPQFFEGITPFIQSARTEKIKQYLPPSNGHGKPKKPRKRK